jgi:hypothetical protein
MATLNAFVWRPAGTKKRLELCRKQIAELWRSSDPLVRNPLPVVTEVGEVEFVAAIGLQAHDFAHGVHELWLSVRGKPHNLVLVAVVRKAQILRQRLVEDAKRMGEENLTVDPDVLAVTDSPSGASEISETINRNDYRLIEW